MTIDNTRTKNDHRAVGNTGMHWWNNGVESKQARESPGEGWIRGRLKSYCDNLSKSLTESSVRKGYCWWTNGKEDKFCKECPDDGWTKGRSNQEANSSKKRESNVKGLKWFSDGKINVRAKECPPGFRPGRSADVNNKIAEASRQSYLNGSHSREGKNAGKHWCHNETEEKFCVEIPDGWLPGRLSR